MTCYRVSVMQSGASIDHILAENQRLRAEVEALRNVEREWLEIVNAAWAAVPESMRAEFSEDTGARHPLVLSVEALRADAGRYRWLRDNCVGTVAPEGIVTTHMELSFIWYSPTWENGNRCDPVSLDSAIKAAMKEAGNA